MSKHIKTNALRILDKNKIPYKILIYECEEFIDAVQIANICKVPVERSFKTLIAQGKSGKYYIFVMRADKHIELKKAAICANEKSISLIPTKECLKVSGYKRGSVSPVGTKKLYETFFHEDMKKFETIFVSGGKKGISIEVNPNELANIINAKFAEF